MRNAHEVDKELELIAQIENFRIPPSNFICMNFICKKSYLVAPRKLKIQAQLKIEI